MNKTVLILAVLAAVSSGCLGGGKKDAPPPAKPGVAGAPAPALERRYRVSADSTGFYHYGPQQPNGPDLSLKKGTNVVLVKRSFGYSQVKTVDAAPQTGYVSTEDITPLTQQELAALAAATSPSPVQSVGGAGKKSRAIVGEYSLPSGPLPNMPDPLPEQQNASTPPPNGMFRY